VASFSKNFGDRERSPAARVSYLLSISTYGNDTYSQIGSVRRIGSSMLFFRGVFFSLPNKRRTHIIMEIRMLDLPRNTYTAVPLGTGRRSDDALLAHPISQGVWFSFFPFSVSPARMTHLPPTTHARKARIQTPPPPSGRLASQRHKRRPFTSNIFSPAVSFFEDGIKGVYGVSLSWSENRLFCNGIYPE